MGNKPLAASSNNSNNHGQEQALPPAEHARMRRKIRHVVHAMKKNPDKPRAQRRGCSLLRKYGAANEAYRPLLIDAGAIPVLSAAMSHHPRNANIQDHSARMLALLAKTDPMASLPSAPLLLQAMQQHKRNSYIQLNGLTAICHWATSTSSVTGDEKHTRSQGLPQEQQREQPGVKVVNEYGGYEVVWSTMTNSWLEFNTAVQDKALKALALLTQHKENRSPFVTAAGWKAILNSLHNHKKEAKIQAKCLKIFKNMSSDHPVSVAKRGLPSILQTMEWHLNDASIQKHGCYIVFLLAASEQCDELLLKAGVREAVVAAMNQHRDKEDIQKTAILALQKLHSNGSNNNHNHNDNLQDNTSNNDTIDAVNGGLEAMIASLNKQETPATTVANICKAMVKVAAASHTNKLDIAAAKGVEAIVQAMGRHKEVENLQRYGCQALTQLAAVETHKLLIVDLQGIEAIGAAMDQHSSQTHLVPLHGILAMLRLAQNVDNHAKIMACNAVEIIVRAMRAHENHAALQHKSVAIFGRLGASSVENKYRILQAGGVHAVIHAMTVHPTHENIQRSSCTTVANLHHPCTSISIVEAGAIRAVVAAMRKHTYHVSIQTAALKAMKEMAQFSYHHPHFAESDGIRAIVSSMQSHLENATLQQLAFALLLLCSDRDYRMRQALVDAGSIGALLLSMNDFHLGHPWIQQIGFSVLYNLSHNAHHGAIIFKHGGFQIVQNVRKACPGDPFIQKYGCTLLVKLVVMFLLHWFLWIIHHV